MARLSFEGLRFSMHRDFVKVFLYKIFEFSLDSRELKAIGEFSVGEDFIEFPKDKEDTVRRKVMFLLGKKINGLNNSLTGNPTTYIHQNSGIPLVGNISFGIVDRGTSLLEIKPVTSCPLNCIYCSIGEGKQSKMHDFVIEREYLVKELEPIVEYKGIKDVEVHIGCQGEPLLYSQLTELVSDISKIKNVSVISMDTNGVLLTSEKVDELIDAGMNQFNISLNSPDQGIADKMAGTNYPVENVIKICEHIAKKKTRLVIAPVYLPGINDSELPKLVEMGKRLGATMGIQNFLEYSHGRRPVGQLSWEEFYARLAELETKLKTKLKLYPEDFNIRPAKSLPKPFKLGDTLKGEILCPGRYRNEAIVALKDRSITVITAKVSGTVNFRIVRTKHNIYLGKSL